MADRILVGIYDEHKIAQEGLSLLLQTVEDFEMVLPLESKDRLLDQLKSQIVHVLLINLHVCDTQAINLIAQISSSSPRVKILILSVNNDEDIVLKTIKAGAKGFLAKDATRQELTEAIYSLRNGHDFFSNSITVLLLKNYITKLKSDDDRSDIRNLSSREIEIMKMWGNSYTNKEIADKLFISVRTVETHKNHIMQKLNLKTSVDLVKFAIRNNIIDL
jgi:two-component system response regulator NreC